MKVISICPSNTEVIAYLGLADQLIAVDDHSDWPPEIIGLPRVGPDLSINMDLVEQLKPDIVLASLSVPGMEKNIAELEKRNIPHIILNPQSLADIENDLLVVSEVLDLPEKGKEVARSFREQFAELKAKSEEAVYKPSLYWEWWPKPVFTPGKVNWLTELSEAVGAYNIFHDINLANIQTDWEEVYKRNPDYICLAWVGVRRQKVNPKIVFKRPSWSNLEALKKEHIFVLEEELFCRPSPRLLEGAKKLAKLIHPDLFK
ncbi:cobalamin-binding protein [Bacillus aquiflavi]|uniref:Cobalamin-binding protein n=1 Tax=Bacillus aquiflavi TaxID=2672567 RepID=A0A6B3VYH0_9BACI|nr:cobalamin-binding protein [Bacillus aquiflavi]MBA4536020.1 cobalamin-binding protein [Bacillus aquiflavi]NEY80394.1 cobalamin-binding protein [Bacillus aquiflavi]UAC47694.1 cobalamin-binding protein [Bacillus aquiflavi]